MIVSIDGQPIETFNDMQRIVSGSADKRADLRGRPRRRDADAEGDAGAARAADRFGNKMRVGMIGIRRNATQQEWEYRRYGPIEALRPGREGNLLHHLPHPAVPAGVVMGRESADQLGGPIGIAEISGQVATLGFVPLLNLVAVISVSIGLINLFPIPLLDGGHLLFYAIEAVRRKPLSERTQEIGFRIGLAIVLMLTVFVTWKDIVGIWLGGVARRRLDLPACPRLLAP